MDAVSYFTFMRDIPFRLPVSVDEPAPYCVDKHVVLKTLLSSIGFKTRYAICRWMWSSLDMPESLKQIPHEDHAVHVYLEVYNNEQSRWMTVDATWDKGLASKLPVSEWDGKSDTSLAIKPLDRMNPIESQEEFDQLKPRIQQAIKVNGKFFEALNKWMESIRT